MCRLFGFAFLLTFATQASAQLLTTEQKLDDFRQMTQIIRSQYGPYDYKISEKILDIPVYIQNAEAKIAATQGNRDFYAGMIEFVAGFQDGHFSTFVPSQRRAIIPLTTDLFQGKVLITKIDRSKLPVEKFNFQVGDEIVSVDGVASADVIKELSIKQSSGNPKTVERVSSWQVVRRMGARMTLPTAKTVKLVIARGASSLTEEIELEWTMSGTSFDEDLMPEKKQPHQFYSFRDELPNQLTMIANDELIRSKDRADADFACNPITRVAIPKNAKMIMSTPVTAYAYETSKGLVGYLRIPHYSPSPKPGQTRQAAYEEWMEAYRFAVSKLEKDTVGLIIDQDHNCGGSVGLVEDMVGLFMQKPFAPIPFSLRGSKAVYLSLKNSLDVAPAASLEIEVYKRMLALIEKTWKENPGSMTPKTPLTGRDLVPVDPIANYTKPIVVLIDEMAGSGGDAFPSMMKGLGRAKLFGQKTSGLGGAIMSYPALNNSQMSFAMTISQFFKPGGEPVENNGADPDRFYEMTREDLMLEYRPYQKAYTDYLLEQLP